MSKDGMWKDGRKMSPMDVTLKAGVKCLTKTIGKNVRQKLTLHKKPLPRLEVLVEQRGRVVGRLEAL